jgi:predicted metal-dependent HD superfamily phosphohydrolase
VIDFGQSSLIRELEAQWGDLCQEQGGAEVFSLLVQFYSESHRAYHNLEHIKALLRLCAEYQNHLSDFDAVRYAVWFHDAIYNPQKGDNEEQSAELAVESLRKLDVSETKVDEVRRMILATKTHNADTFDKDGELFLDFDLSILGAEADVYWRYSAAIREEYAFVPTELYRNGRRGVLEKFLEREFIYFTDECRERFDAQARKNIAAEIADLSS